MIFVFGTMAVVSKLAFGFLAERIPVQYLVMACFAGSALGLLILIQAESPQMVLAYGVVYGLMRGGYTTLQSIAWADYFGRAHLGTIRGVFQPLHFLSTATGPLMAGFLYDSSRNYDTAFSVFVALYLLAAGVMLLAPRPRLPIGKPQATDAAPASP